MRADRWIVPDYPSALKVAELGRIYELRGLIREFASQIPVVPGF